MPSDTNVDRRLAHQRKRHLEVGESVAVQLGGKPPVPIGDGLR